MDFLPGDIATYAEQYTEKENEVLAGLNRETWSKTLQPRMISGHIQGRLLSLISHMIRPNRILEIGTFTGYSAICMAEGLSHNGKLITIDINEEYHSYVLRYAERAGMAHRIEALIGDALEVIPTLNEQFDLVFIDADKVNYSNYYDLVFEKVGPHGFIIADNMLWSGKVLDEKKDDDTKALVEFAQKISSDDRVENLLLPVRDGLMICRKLPK